MLIEKLSTRVTSGLYDNFIATARRLSAGGQLPLDRGEISSDSEKNPAASGLSLAVCSVLAW
jgi:hypothetical protein